MANSFLIVCVAAMSFWVIQASAKASFIDQCKSAHRSRAFEDLILRNLSDQGLKQEFIRRGNCLAVEQSVATNKVVIAESAIQLSENLSYFKKVSTFSLTTKEVLYKLDLGVQPNLRIVMVLAPLRIPSLLPLAKLPKLEHLAISGSDDASWIGARGISKLKTLEALTLLELKLQDRGEIKPLESKVSIRMVRVTPKTE